MGCGPSLAGQPESVQGVEDKELAYIEAGTGWAIHGLVFVWGDGSRTGTVLANNGSVVANTRRDRLGISEKVLPHERIKEVSGRNCTEGYLAWAIDFRLTSGRYIQIHASHHAWAGGTFAYDATPGNHIVGLKFNRRGSVRGIEEKPLPRGVEEKPLARQKDDEGSNDEIVEEEDNEVDDYREEPQAPQIPSYWKNQDDGASFEDWIDLSKDEMSTIEEMMTATWTGKRTRDRTGEMPIGMQLVKASRIENSELWNKYAQRCLELRQQRRTFTPMRDTLGTGLKTDMSWRDRVAHDLNEVYVWHGTTPLGATGIASDGFRIDLAGTRAGTMFGKGVYFAECTSKSDEYAGDDTTGPYKGVYCMLLCRAVLGQTLRTMEGRRSSGKASQQQIEDAVTSKACDSVVGDREACVGTYREIIVYDEGQAYPEYVILYTRKY